MKFRTVISVVFNVTVGWLIVCYLPTHLRQHFPQAVVRALIVLSIFIVCSILNTIIFTFNDDDNSFLLKICVSPLRRIPRIIREFIWGNRFLAKIDDTWSLVWGRVMPNEMLKYNHGNESGEIPAKLHSELTYYRALDILGNGKFSKTNALETIAEWNVAELRKKYPTQVQPNNNGKRITLTNRRRPRGRDDDVFYYYDYPRADGIGPGVVGEVRLQTRGFLARVAAFRKRWFR